MIKRTLIAIAVVALLATSAQAGLKEYYFGLEAGDHSSVKVDGTEKIRWPYEYKSLVVCNIPIKMNIGMYVQVIDCNKKKIILEQVPCGDVGKGDKDYPCYMGCVEFDVRANFEVKLGAKLKKDGDIIKDWSAAYEGGDVVAAGGGTTTVKLCVKAWKTQIYNHVAGDEVVVGSVDITVKPNT